MQNTLKKKLNAMRSTTETLLYAVDTDGLGNGFVTATLLSIPSVSSATSRESWFLWSKSITSNLWLKEEHMSEAI